MPWTEAAKNNQHTQKTKHIDNSVKRQPHLTLSQWAKSFLEESLHSDQTISHTKPFFAVQNQHEDLKKQYYELQDQHAAQGQDHNRLLGQHREHLLKLQQAKDGEISQLKGASFIQTHSGLHEVTEKKTKKNKWMKS